MPCTKSKRTNRPKSVEKKCFSVKCRLFGLKLELNRITYVFSPKRKREDLWSSFKTHYGYILAFVFSLVLKNFLNGALFLGF